MKYILDDTKLSPFQKGIQNFLKNKFSYKPSLEVYVLPHENFENNVNVWLNYKTKDVNTNENFTFSGRKFLSKEELGENWQQSLAAILWDWILEAEIHEAKEWFKISGKNYMDPHPNE